MTNITQRAPQHNKTTLRSTIAKLWPNGEFSVYRPKKVRLDGLRRLAGSVWEGLSECLIRAYGIMGALEALAVLGLSNHQNFDNVEKKTARYGLKGISSKGRRRIRNACYHMTRDVGRGRLTFATVTVPDMDEFELETIHQYWHELIDTYRREVSRHLKREGLPGEIVGCTEIQPKRFLRTGKPFLHAHFVFVGKGTGAHWALSTAQHDKIWSKAICGLLGKKVKIFGSACNLREVHSNAAVYLSKYMSKGVGEIELALANGFELWLPSQWWSCSRSLVARQEKEMRTFSDGANLFYWLKDSSDKEFLAFFKDVYVPVADGEEVYVASYGALTKRGNGLVRQILDL